MQQLTDYMKICSKIKILLNNFAYELQKENFLLESDGEDRSLHVTVVSSVG